MIDVNAGSTTEDFKLAMFLTVESNPSSSECAITLSVSILSVNKILKYFQFGEFDLHIALIYMI